MQSYTRSSSIPYWLQSFLNHRNLKNPFSVSHRAYLGHPPTLFRTKKIHDRPTWTFSRVIILPILTMHKKMGKSFQIDHIFASSLIHPKWVPFKDPWTFSQGLSGPNPKRAAGAPVMTCHQTSSPSLRKDSQLLLPPTGYDIPPLQRGNLHPR